MKPLKKQFIGLGEVKGFIFYQIRVANQAFLYEVDHDGTKHYEVFKRVINRRFACVSYPTSNSFGKWAWTFKLLVDAEETFKELIK